MFFFRNSNNEIYVLLRWRSDSISETNVFDLSFSGLIDYFDLEGNREELLSVIKNEIVDELSVDFNNLRIKDFQILGLVLNPKYLYQPELIISIEIDKYCINMSQTLIGKIDFDQEGLINYLLDKMNRIKIVKYEKIKYIYEKFKVKNLFKIAVQLFEKKILNI